MTTDCRLCKYGKDTICPSDEDKFDFDDYCGYFTEVTE